MAYDEGLAERIRDCLAHEEGVVEKKMFGGIAFMVDGNLAVGVRGEDLMARVGPDAVDEVLGLAGARRSFMGEREMKGWILVAPAGVEGDALGGWVARGVAF